LYTRSDLKEVREQTPADGKIAGFGHIDEREIYVGADDVTVFAGAGGRVGMTKGWKGKEYAVEKGIPVINLGDAAGARMPDILGSDGLMKVSWPIDKAPRDRRVPMVAAIMGECFGLPSWTAAVSDIVIQIKGTIYAVGGASIITVATGEFAEDDRECLALIRRVLSYLPSSSSELPPVIPCHDDPRARLDAVFKAVPEDSKQTYDMHHLIEMIADEGSMLELKPNFDASLITTLARIDGQVTGILANNPMVTAGAMGPGACEKATSFICLCDSFNIPLLFLHDTPGFMLCKEAEERKMPMLIMRFIEALQMCSVPRVSVIIRKSYGMAHFNMSGGRMQSDQLMAWPIADISFMAPEVAVNVIYGRKLQDANDPDKEARGYIEELQRGSAPWEAATLNLIDKVIDPRDTRMEIIRAFRRARGTSGRAGMSKRLMANWPKMC
jgi:acetyl-CoA carboxylase carboxyltransferase component